jgi:hypothetical protein
LGVCRPFSEIDVYLQDGTEPGGCLVDTNFLIAVSDKEHPLHEDAQFIQDKLADYSMALLVSVSARAEFIDYKRRVIATENLMGMLAPTSKWKISSAVREALTTQKAWIDGQAKRENDPYLSDSRLKTCKQIFMPRNQSGQIGWLEFCKEYLDGRLTKSWQELVDTLKLCYIDMRAEDSKDLFRKELRWEEMYQKSEHTALGSQDAMILNLLDASTLPFVVTMDFDLAYGVMASTQDKVALVPDNLYRNRLKKLRF